MSEHGLAAASFDELIRAYCTPEYFDDLALLLEGRDGRCDTLHTAAMAACDAAAELRGTPEGRYHLANALRLEVGAAALATSQPTHAILHRSAATIALDADLPRDAIRLASAALARPDVPEKLFGELIEVLSRAIAPPAKEAPCSPQKS